jgi:hypothetical protein
MLPTALWPGEMQEVRTKGMRRLLLLLRYPALVEVLNVFVHQSFRRASEEWHWLDILTTAVTLLVMGWIGWILARERRPYTRAIGAALVLWLTVVAFAALAGQVEFKLGVRSYTPETHYAALEGFFIGSVLAVPIVIVAAILGIWASRRLRRSD